MGDALTNLLGAFFRGLWSIITGSGALIALIFVTLVGVVQDTLVVVLSTVGCWPFSADALDPVWATIEWVQNWMPIEQSFTLILCILGTVAAIRMVRAVLRVAPVVNG